MYTSNIIAGSNVYLVRSNDPFYDPEFVKQIQDYELLKFIKKRKSVDDSIEFPFGNQGAILKSEMRCIYAKKDPCFGYDQSQRRMVCDCINGNCPQIKKCNPNYSSLYAESWNTKDEEVNLYGNPKTLAVYYLVDLTSEFEKNNYYAEPGNDGIDYPIPPAPVMPDDRVIKDEIINIDPITGKKREIIAYKKLKYPDDDGIGEPIWGFVGEYSYDKYLSIVRKAKPIEKKEGKINLEKYYDQSVLKINKKQTDITDKIDFEYKKKIDNEVIDNIIENVKLTEFHEKDIDLSNTVLLFDNPAELAFVSSTFLVNDIDFGIDEDSGLVLSLLENYDKYKNKNHVVISNTALKNGCNELTAKIWKELAGRNDLTRLNISSREYYSFDFSNGSRWVCSNLYSVTHICIEDSDIIINQQMDDGLYNIIFVFDGNNYSVINENEEVIGKVQLEFNKIIQKLIDEDKIDRFPDEIKGIALKIFNGKKRILGIGHLKNMGY